MQEFELIRQIQQETSVSSEGVKLGIGDDAAIMEVPRGKFLVAATDTLNADRHFPADTEAFDIGHKCLAVNLSDLAAMGAAPRWALLSLSLPEPDTRWLRAFTAGFRSLAQVHNVSLVGGDTTRGPLSINVTAMGLIEAGKGLLRSDAKVGDLLVVSGTVGGAARVLDLLQSGVTVRDRELLDRPQPRVRLGQALSGYANACIDVSDGLLADLNHILRASNCAAQIDVSLLPGAKELQGLEDAQKWTYQLAGGDDYELLFTLPPQHQGMLERWREQLNLNVTVIGTIVEGEGVQCFDANGQPFEPQRPGFEHFPDSHNG
jgi:thiamine-monophosphate kinase